MRWSTSARRAHRVLFVKTAPLRPSTPEAPSGAAPPTACIASPPARRATCSYETKPCRLLIAALPAPPTRTAWRRRSLASVCGTSPSKITISIATPAHDPGRCVAERMMSGRLQVLFSCYHRVVFLVCVRAILLSCSQVRACLPALLVLSSLSCYLQIPNTSVYRQQNNARERSSLRRLLVARVIAPQQQ
jgi:hypothetical protein